MRQHFTLKQGLLGLLLLSAQAELRADSYQHMISAARGDELLQRQLDLEARQLQLERKIQELEATVAAQARQSRDAEADQRMHPRHIDVIKKPLPNLPPPPPADYSVYPLINR